MATSFLSYNFTTLQQSKSSKSPQTYAFDPICRVSIKSKHNDKCSFASNGSLESCITYQRPRNEPILKRDFAVHAIPETAEGFLSFLPADTPWYAWAAGFMVALPFAINKLINLTNEVEAVADAIEDVADNIGKVADNIDKAADELTEKMPEGKFKDLVKKLDNIAEATSKEAQKVEDLMDKVEEMSNEVEDFIVEKTKKQAKVTTTTTTDKN